MIISRRQEILIAVLIAFSLFLAAVYARLSLSSLTKGKIFVQQAALPCTLTSCGQCDLNQDGGYNYQDTASLKLYLTQTGCSQANIDSSLSWCLANCYVPDQSTESNWQCRTQVFSDPNCQQPTWRFEFNAPTDQSTACQPMGADDSSYATTRCWPGQAK